MSRKLLAVAAAIALVGAGMALGSLSTASSQTRGPNVTIKAFSPDNRAVEENVHAPPRGQTLGDYFVGVSPLLNKPGGKKIGSEKHDCVDIAESENSFSAMCTAQAWFDGRGKISVQGSFKVEFREFQHGRPAAVLAVTGGTGEFRNARGVVKLTFREHGILFEFDLP